MNLPRMLEGARRLGFRRWLLNAGLRWSIPFNAPHGFRVVPLPDGGMRVLVPYKRANRNHIRGLHACCLATAAELCSGLVLLGHLDPKRYRIIMPSLAMEYHWQAKGRAVAEFRISREDLQKQVLAPLQTEESVRYAATVEVKDESGRLLATGTIHWQVKAWDNVRTKV